MSIFQIPTHIKGFIFDIDGTLADTMPAHYRASSKAAQHYGFEFPLDYFVKSAGTPTIKVFETLMELQGVTNVNAEEVSALKEKYYLEEVPFILPINYTMDIVKEFHGKIPMSMGTGGTLEIALPNIKQIGVDAYIDILVTAEDVTKHKPFPDTFLECAKRMHLLPRECLVFEDAINGFKAAEAAGMEWIDVTQFHAITYSN